MIEVSHLSKSYGSRPAVQDLSFTVPDGQIYGLLGPNGAGKRLNQIGLVEGNQGLDACSLGGNQGPCQLDF